MQGQKGSIGSNQETRNLTMWGTGESSSTTVPNQESPNQVDPKIGHAWSPPIKAHPEPHNPHQDVQPTSQLSLGDVHMNPAHTHASIGHHHHGHNGSSSSSGPVEMEVRPRSRKRKATQVHIGQESSGTESPNLFHGTEGISSSSLWQSGSENQTPTSTIQFDPIIPRLGPGIGGVSSEIRRNVRIRISNSRQQDQLLDSIDNSNNNAQLDFLSLYPSLGHNPNATTGDNSSSRAGPPMLQAPHISSTNMSSSSRASQHPISSVITAPTEINWNLNSNSGPYRGLPLDPSRRRTEFLRRSLLSSIDSRVGGGGGRTDNLFSSIPPPINASTSSTQESGMPPVIGMTGNHPRHHLPNLRTSDRQLDGGVGLPYLARTMAGEIERRRRIASEFRNLIRRREGLRLEDFMILDQSGFYGVADIHDRHRDMRLDTDNMSYEELLALEERIGNVNTGLSEEKIHKHLKQKAIVSVADRVDAEPCCICQEEYKNGDDLGELECGHDFHTSCIKQWLLQKNVCPVCKSEASK